MEEKVRGRITVEEGEKRSAAFSSPPPSNSHLSPAKSSRGHTHSLSLSGEKNRINWVFFRWKMKKLERSYPLRRFFSPTVSSSSSPVLHSWILHRLPRSGKLSKKYPTPSFDGSERLQTSRGWRYVINRNSRTRHLKAIARSCRDFTGARAGASRSFNCQNAPYFLTVWLFFHKLTNRTRRKGKGDIVWE